MGTTSNASPRIGDPAPDFTASTTAGEIHFLNWKAGSWAVLFSHPKNFTPVCTTELGRMAQLKTEFDKRGVKILGLSVDQLDAHGRWVDDIKDVTGNGLNFPLIADAERTVSELYGMLDPESADSVTVRSVFVIGPDDKIKLMITYPQSTGRNFDEILRVVDSLQLTATHAVSTPADWRQGDDVIIIPAVSDEEALARFPRGFKALKPYLRTVPQPGPRPITPEAV
jgi:alkyl hydroperoxide reductase subunit AhpC